MPNKKDLTGKKFGKLTVLGEDGHIRRGKQSCVTWLCQCECGNKISVTTGALTSGNTKSCGCLVREAASKKVKDLAGQRFGKLTVVSRAENVGKKVAWKCVCDCGNETIASSTNLVQGNTKSCGCDRIERLVKMNSKHGEAHTRLYRVWQGMRERCQEENHISYQYYGARGIKVCDEWNNSYEAFRDWALNNGYDVNAPRGGCTLDRINVDGNYEPSNCRWVSMEIQNKNKRILTV